MLAAPAAASAQGMKPKLVTFLTPLGSPTAASSMATDAALEVSTSPLGTSTGGFTFNFDPTLRVWTRSASSFGPAFSERSITTGRARVSIGFNWLHASYNSFAGQDLQNADFKPARSIHIAALPAVVSSAVQMKLSSDTMVLFGHVGITDNLDVGVAVPWMSVKMSGTGAFFGAADNNLQSSTLPETSASGVGDVAIFGKYRFWRKSEGGAAVAAEVRLPSGDTQALRGLGVTRTLVSGIWSRGGRISPHANLGFEYWSKKVPIFADGTVSARNQVKYAAGVELEPSARITLVVDVVGRDLLGGGGVEYQSIPAFSPGDTLEALVATSKGVHAVSLAPSLKWNVWRSILLTGNVLLNLSNNGLKADAIPVLGFDWAF